MREILFDCRMATSVAGTVERQAPLLEADWGILQILTATVSITNIMHVHAAENNFNLN